jgi:hypothetical protein
MTEMQANTLIEQLADIFASISQGMKSVIRQELHRGNYDPDKVLEWANWRRAETADFEITDLRKEFKQDQPATRPEDGATRLNRENREKIDADYAAAKPELEQIRKFFDDANMHELDELKAEYLATVPDQTRLLLEPKAVHECNFLKHGIWKMLGERANEMQRG